MTTTWFLVLCQVAVITCALVSGIFLTFSSFLMRSLKLAQPQAGIEVMQIINAEVWKSVFMVMLWGDFILTGGLALYAWLNMTGPVVALLIAGAVAFFLGVQVISFAVNIPMNKRLDRWEYSAPEAATYWNIYVPDWVWWNYLRAILTGLSAVSFLIAITWMAQG